MRRRCCFASKRRLKRTRRRPAWSAGALVARAIRRTGPFLTDRLRSGIEYETRREKISFEEMLTKGSQSNPTGRVGDPREFGDACAFLCAASSGFIVGQNLLLDGGAFNSTMG
jgi:NAD(P)-dependent dehydrogenase (short-subunit alcohol dehydrogenase family)